MAYVHAGRKMMSLNSRDKWNQDKDLLSTHLTCTSFVSCSLFVPELRSQSADPEPHQAYHRTDTVPVPCAEVPGKDP